MNEKRIKEIELQIDSRLLKILSPIRMNRTIDEKEFEMLFSLLQELNQLLSSEKNIPRSLTGLLFSIYITVIAASENSHYQSPIFIASSKLEAYLMDIFGVQ